MKTNLIILCAVNCLMTSGATCPSCPETNITQHTSCTQPFKHNCEAILVEEEEKRHRPAETIRRRQKLPPYLATPSKIALKRRYKQKH